MRAPPAPPSATVEATSDTGAWTRGLEGASWSGMLRFAPLVCVLLSSCYLSHTRDEAGDGAIDGAWRPDGACCVALGCAGEACGAGEECTPGGCAPLCEGPRCGGGCCGAEELCAGERCVPVGPPCADDGACAPAELCDPIVRRCAPAPRASCMEARPMEPVVRWEDTSVMAINVPLVVPLDGDAIPDIVVLTVPRSFEARRTSGDRNSLIAYSGSDGRRLWELGMFTSPCSHSPPAAGDVDGDGQVEIVVLARVIEPHSHVSENPDDPLPCAPCDRGGCGPFRADNGTNHEHTGCEDPRVAHVHAECANYGDPPGAVVIVSSDGEVERVVPLPILPRPNEMDAIEIVDLDADGSAEIVTHGVVIDADGIRWSDERLSGVGMAIGDLDGDGKMEIVTAQHAFEHDGTLRWSVTADERGHPVIGDVLRDPVSRGPTVIVADGRSVVVRDGATGAPLLGPLGFGAGYSSGPPNLADFDGDGRPEIGVPADHGYVVIDPDLPEPPYVRWTVPTADRTPGTVGASAFDFDADGAADVAYADECQLRLLSGRDGAILHVRSNPSLTVWEYPVVADVDADGEAELVVTSNVRRLTQIEHAGCAAREGGFTETPGAVRVLEDRLHNWGATHGMWNQHAYHIDNVLADGRIPAEPPRPWATHGTWRANPRFPDPRDVHLPSLRVTALAVQRAGCTLEAVVRARVENHGARGAEPGEAIVLSAAGRTLATAHTTRALLPGAAEWVQLPPLRSQDLESPLRAQIDPPSPCAAGEPIVILEPACAP